MCAFNSLVLWASVHVMPVGGVVSIAMQKAVFCVHVIEEWHGYSSVFKWHLFVLVKIMLKYTFLNYI